MSSATRSNNSSSRNRVFRSPHLRRQSAASTAANSRKETSLLISDMQRGMMMDKAQEHIGNDDSNADSDNRCVFWRRSSLAQKFQFFMLRIPRFSLPPVSFPSAFIPRITVK